MVPHNYDSSLVVEVKYKQHLDPLLMELKESVLGMLNESFSQCGDGVLRYQGRLCVLDFEDLRNQILEEYHGSRYSIHPGETKMYHDLREVYWGDDLNKDISEFVAKCPNRQQDKDENLKPGGLTQITDFLHRIWKSSIWTLLVGCLEPESKIILYGLLWVG